MLHMFDTVQQALQVFSSTQVDALEVFDYQNNIVGVLTLHDLDIAIETGQLDKTVDTFLNKNIFETIASSLKKTEISDYTTLIQSNLFTEIIDSLYDAIYITDGNGITVKINKAYVRITGINAEEVIGYHMTELITKGYISNSVSVAVIKENRPITMMQTIKNGRNVIVSGTPIYDENKEIIYVINNVRDITELLHMKHELEELQSVKTLRQSSKKNVHQSE